jgi:hypothetical protein
MTKTQQLQAAYDDAKKHCNHFPEDGIVKFERGDGYSVWTTEWHGLAKEYRQSQYCWLGQFERGMRFFAQAKATGRANLSNLRVGVR